LLLLLIDRGGELGSFDNGSVSSEATTLIMDEEYYRKRLIEELDEECKVFVFIFIFIVVNNFFFFFFLFVVY
jgi:hypothetical protein